MNVGPLQSTFRSWAGNSLIDWLFMLGLLSIGAALVLGIGLRIAAVSGIALVALMWLAVYPPARHTSTGTPTGSNNPLVDDHVLEAMTCAAREVTARNSAARGWSATTSGPAGDLRGVAIAPQVSQYQ